jgi:hypothetical protein
MWLYNYHENKFTETEPAPTRVVNINISHKEVKGLGLISCDTITQTTVEDKIPWDQ